MSNEQWRRVISPVLILAGLASIIAMWFCARQGWRFETGIPAALFAAFVVWQSIRMAWSQPPGHDNGAPHDALAQRSRLADTSRLSALVFAWGGLAMFVLYYGTELSWQHGWQYGAAMLLLAAANGWYAATLDEGTSPLVSQATLSRTAQLACVQGLAIVGALVWLIVSGKLETPKDDWAANHIFMAGGVAIAALSFAFAKIGCGERS